MSLGKNISGSSHRYLTNSETEKVFWGLLGLPTFCHEISRNRKKIVFLMSYAKKVLNICKIDLFCNYLFSDNFNYVTWFWVRWGAKIFDASVARKIILAPHSKLANRWGASLSLDHQKVMRESKEVQLCFPTILGISNNHRQTDHPTDPPTNERTNTRVHNREVTLPIIARRRIYRKAYTFTLSQLSFTFSFGLAKPNLRPPPPPHSPPASFPSPTLPSPCFLLFPLPHLLLVLILVVPLANPLITTSRADLSIHLSIYIHIYLSWYQRYIQLLLSWLHVFLNIQFCVLRSCFQVKVCNGNLDTTFLLLF